MKWVILSVQAPPVVLAFVAACNEPDKTKREPLIAASIVAAYRLIEPLLGSKPGALKVRAVIDEFLPQIAAKFGA